jgi:hypothetical protein
MNVRKPIFFLSLFLQGAFFLLSDTVQMPNSILSWQKCSYGTSGDNCEIGKPIKLTWEKANSICKELKTNGLDWRLPEKEEIYSLLTLDTKPPRIEADFFPNTEAGNYWSTEDSSGNKLYLNFYSGDFGTYTGSSKTAYLRCVATTTAPVNVQDAPYTEKLKKNLPFNWYLTINHSNVRLERGRKVWKYPGNKWEEVNEKILKKIQKIGEQKDCVISFHVEKKWTPAVLQKIITQNEKIEKEIQKLDPRNKAKINSLQKQITSLPDYEWDGDYLFLKEETCKEDSVHTIYPREALEEIEQIMEILKPHRFAKQTEKPETKK